MIVNENAGRWDGPEGHLGLKQVASIEMSQPNYSFDTLACWWDPDTEGFYFAKDSGCSCPCPFENHTTPDKFEGPFTRNEARFKFLNSELPEWEDQSYLPRFVDDKTSAAKAVAEFNTDGESDDS